ncbi:MAG TPA: hypothetical protein PKY56_08810 [Candidatus Kapabacteria bacterium]|nr:hypothetical protein [Candidatus Kapabacteria bacterium]HPO63390.1 hypothetical protein [Candidatus Kapabacteria bacterium]
MRKILFLFVLLFVLIQNTSFSETQTYTETRTYNGGIIGDYYETVQIRCFGDGCYLYCNEAGSSYICGWDGVTWCDGCDDSWYFFMQGQGQVMFDYAKNQINSSVSSGSYSNTLIISDTEYITRTITWEVTQEANQNVAEMQLVMTSYNLELD